MGYEVTHSDLRIRPGDKEINYSSPNPIDHYDLRIVSAPSREESEQEAAAMPKGETPRVTAETARVSTENRKRLIVSPRNGETRCRTKQN